jgi:hypothetical protein
MEKPTYQTELPLTNQAVNLLPEKVLAECRQLLAQLLCEVLLAEKKEAQHEH